MRRLCWALTPASELVPFQTNDPVTNICHAADKQLFTLVEWAKRIPHFSGLTLEDQVILLRAGRLLGPLLLGTIVGAAIGSSPRTLNPPEPCATPMAESRGRVALSLGGPQALNSEVLPRHSQPPGTVPVNGGVTFPREFYRLRS